MKLFILTLFALFLAVRTEEQIAEDQKDVDTSLYETFVHNFFGNNAGINLNGPAKRKGSNNRNNSNSNKAKNNKKNKNNVAAEEVIKIDYKVPESEIIAYVDEYPKNYYYQNNYKLVGREGLGFDFRTAKTNGFTVPLTPKLLEVLRRNYYVEKKNEQPAYPVIV